MIDVDFRFELSFSFFHLAPAEKEEKAVAHSKLIEEIRERNRQREHEATFTEIWYTFVDPYATDVDERGTGRSKIFPSSQSHFLYSDDAHKAVGILTVKNGKRIIGRIYVEEKISKEYFHW